MNITAKWIQRKQKSKNTYESEPFLTISRKL
jgi:hypothetical protein